MMGDISCGTRDEWHMGKDENEEEETGGGLEEGEETN